MTTSASAWQLRRARLDDAAELARLVTELGYPVDEATIVPRLKALLGEPHHFIAVAHQNDHHLSGFIVAEHRCLLLYGAQVEIMGLSVGNETRRLGVCRALVEAVENWAQQFGDGPIVVRSNVTRPESHPFYQQLGYARKKTQHLYSRSLGKGAGA